MEGLGFGIHARRSVSIAAKAQMTALAPGDFSSGLVLEALKPVTVLSAVAPRIPAIYEVLDGEDDKEGEGHGEEY